MSYVWVELPFFRWGARDGKATTENDNDDNYLLKLKNLSIWQRERVAFVVYSLDLIRRSKKGHGAPWAGSLFWRKSVSTLIRHEKRRKKTKSSNRISTINRISWEGRLWALKQVIIAQKKFFYVFVSFSFFFFFDYNDEIWLWCEFGTPLFVLWAALNFYRFAAAASLDCASIMSPYNVSVCVCVCYTFLHSVTKILGCHKNFLQ